MSPGGSTPLVKGFGYSGSLFSVYGLGLSYNFELDIFLGYVMPILHIFVLSDKIVINPQLYTEIATNNYILINLGSLSFRVNFDFSGFKYTIANYFFVQDLQNYADQCYGLEYSTSALTMKVYTEEFVNECSWGLLGYFYNENPLCR